MATVGFKRRLHKRGAPALLDLAKYPSRLQMYTTPPDDDLSLEEFEVFALDRLRVLKALEHAKIRWAKSSDEFEKRVHAVTKQYLPLSDDANEGAPDERRKDHVSHFVLRLAFCRTEENRRWLAAQETELFRFRLAAASPREMEHLMRSNNLTYTTLSPGAKVELEGELKAVHRSEFVDENDFFEVPFEQALDQIRDRRVLLKRGVAFVPRSAMVSIVVGRFRSQLSSSLALMSKVLPSLEEDDRLMPRLKSLSKNSVGNEFRMTESTAQVCVSDIPKLASESFPLCMRNLYEALVSNHHLKDHGRQQFNLFLKGIGLTLEDALLFWRSEFLKSMPMDKFDKQYAYNIRHNYGKEGKRTDYTPLGCQKIITGPSPGSGEHHGCPFRHFDKAALSAKLLSYRVPAPAIAELVELVETRRYQIACQRYFEITHATSAPDMILVHPNQYFKESRRILTGEKPAAAAPKPGTSGPDALDADDEAMLASAEFFDETALMDGD